MKVHGECHCGDIKFEAEVDPANARICHCIDCQTMSGSAFRTGIAAPAETLKMISGTPTRYIKTADSGVRRAHMFCSRCGSPVFSSSVDPNPTRYQLRIGMLKERHQLAPKAQIWTRSEQHWLDEIGDLPAVETQ
jgi:hypothetical protein